MTDIVERLRAEDTLLCIEAAEEIERLRAQIMDEYIQFYDVELETMRHVTQKDWDTLAASLIKLQRHIEKLEAAQAVTAGTLEAPAEPEAPFTVTPAESNTPR